MQAVESLKICTLIRSFCPEHIKFRWKNIEELCFLALKNNAKLKEKLTLASRNDIRNLVNFHPTTQKSKNFILMDYFCRKYMRFEIKKCSGVTFHDTEQWCKIRIDLDLVVSKMAWGIGWTFIRALKSLKTCTLMVSFCPKHIVFQLENFTGIMCHDTGGWCKNLKENLLID